MKRTTRQFYLATLFIFLTTVPSAFADSSNNKLQWVAVGVGATDSCGKYLSETSEHPPGRGEEMEWRGEKYYDMSSIYAGWIQGYITAINLAGLDTSQQINIDYPGIDSWVRKWCESNPEKALTNAVAAFVVTQCQCSLHPNTIPLQPEKP